MLAVAFGISGAILGLLIQIGAKYTSIQLNKHIYDDTSFLYTINPFFIF